MPEQLAPDETPRRRRRLRWLPRALFESLLIIFSVLLALGLDEWREERELDRRVEQARVHFAREICGNRLQLASPKYLPFHRRLQTVWRELVSTRDPPAEQVQAAQKLVYNGFNVIRLRDAVWRSVSGSQLMERMPPEDIYVLADIYEKQEALDALNASMSTAWRQITPYADDPAYVRDQRRSTQAWLGDVVQLESDLVALYDRALDQLGRSRGEDAGPFECRAAAPARQP